ncbi:DoxX family protein [Longimicrobium terrae]|uniref:Putative oxidoreductase n=1 Tax=Longimicrobium terrae TaxID=1639882 RepID=A0A841GZ63_9BACT|nr:DoxX family protein [Longimicrobium terrae]MBB4636429.1 putative oxidoreductase [Longimicrobium terrae]MBB6071047.1 putative oxidoreductase [Longimicrobium terrae]NNC29068.1 DoxX family protein [Longimicrobium terrae]
MARTFFMQRFEEPALALLRIVAGGMLMQHGAQKLFGVLGGFGGTPGARAELASQMGLAGVIEFFVALLVLLGLFTRPAAFLTSGMMAAAYFMAHAPNGFFPLVNQGELAALYCFVFLYLSARGGGKFSVDAMLESRAAVRRTRI